MRAFLESGSEKTILKVLKRVLPYKSTQDITGPFMKKWKHYANTFPRVSVHALIAVAAISCFVFGFSAFRDRIGILVWNTLHTPDMALALHRDAGFAVAIGNYYFNVGGTGAYDLVRARTYYEKALQMDPQVPDAWHQLARIEFLRGNFYGAYDKINKQIELHGNSFMASYYIRGLINGFLGNTNGAEKDFKTFLAWDAKNWAAHNDLAWVYFTKGDYRNTEVIAREGLAFNPGNPWLLTSLGLALLNEGKKEEAHMILADALKESGKLTAADWHHAYPGNDPGLGDTGLEKMRSVIRHNLTLSR